MEIQPVTIPAGAGIQTRSALKRTNPLPCFFKIIFLTVFAAGSSFGAAGCYRDLFYKIIQLNNR